MRFATPTCAAHRALKAQVQLHFHQAPSLLFSAYSVLPLPFTFDFMGFANSLLRLELLQQLAILKDFTTGLWAIIVAEHLL